MIHDDPVERKNAPRWARDKRTKWRGAWDEFRTFLQEAFHEQM
jgi:hypothetical protein